VIVFGGPVTVSDLAQAEQVQLPTISRLVKALEGQGLVRREVDPEDRRVVRIHATARGESVLDEGRTRRVRALSSQLEGLPPEDLAVLSRAAEIMEDLSAGGRS
jgi:DNA-binding MarR family transcriptional regulator